MQQRAFGKTGLSVAWNRKSSKAFSQSGHKSLVSAFGKQTDRRIASVEGARQNQRHQRQRHHNIGPCIQLPLPRPLQRKFSRQRRQIRNRIEVGWIRTSGTDQITHQVKMKHKKCEKSSFPPGASHTENYYCSHNSSRKPVSQKMMIFEIVSCLGALR